MRACLGIGWALAAVMAVGSASAQQFRSAPTLIRGGIAQHPVVDSLRVDSLGLPSLGVDSLGGSLRSAAYGERADSMAADPLRFISPADSLPSGGGPGSIAADPSGLDADTPGNRPTTGRKGAAGSPGGGPIAARRVDTARLVYTPDTLTGKRSRALRDTMSISKVTGLSFVAPGFGQIYNKQYWKLPILYTTMGVGLGMGFHENKIFRTYKKQVKAITDLDQTRTEELDALQTQMNRHNTARQLYFFGAIASYLYFIGDAAVNYKGDDVSRIKKATTLSMICPGAGQIYNGSYWKAPIVLGAFASMIYIIDWNNRGYQRFKTAFHLQSEYEHAHKEWQNDPQHDPDAEPKPHDEFKGRYNATYLKNLKDNYRRNRDLSIIITVGVYLLNVIDAHVDAHLRDFDISDDLTMNVAPSMGSLYTQRDGVHNTYGFGLTFTF